MLLDQAVGSDQSKRKEGTLPLHDLAKTLAFVITLLAAALGVVSSICLVRGSRQMIAAEQSWGGRTDGELRFRRTNELWTKGGLWLLGLAFICQAAAAVLGYLG